MSKKILCRLTSDWRVRELVDRQAGQRQLSLEILTKRTKRCTRSKVRKEAASHEKAVPGLLAHTFSLPCDDRPCPEQQGSGRRIVHGAMSHQHSLAPWELRAGL